MRLSILSATSQDATVVRLQDALFRLSSRTESRVFLFDAVDRMFDGNEPECVFICFSGNAGRVFDVVQRVRAHTPQPIVVVGSATDGKLILRAMKLGADLFLDESEIEAELGSVLARFRGKFSSDTPLGEVHGVMPVGGGCGGSTLAINIASLWAKQYRRCVLIDLNPGRGDLATLLDLRPQYSLANVCANESRLDLAMFEKMLTAHESGIQLLASPPEFHDARFVTPEGVDHALKLARESASRVVIDLEDCFHDEQVEALRQLNGLCLVSRLDFTSMRNARRILDYLNKINIGCERISVVLNQTGLAGELSLEDAEQALGRKIAARVPHDPKLVNAANNTGIPAVVKDPESKFAESLRGLLGIASDKAKKSSGILPRLKGICKSYL